MTEFEYKPRTLRDVAVRVNQTRDEVDKAPKVDELEICARCNHRRWEHCFVRKSLKNRSVLWFCEYGLPHARQIAWERVIGTHLPQNHALHPVKCRHATQADFPLCSSAACTRKACECGSFLSPLKKPPKPRVPKVPKVKALRKKRVTRAKAQQQIDFGNPRFPAKSSPL